MAWKLSFCIGVASLWLAPQLLPVPFCLILLLAATLHGMSGRRSGSSLACCALLAGLGYAHMAANLQLDRRLPLAWDGREFVVEGQVRGIVLEERGSQFGRERTRQRFDFQVETLHAREPHGDSETAIAAPGKLRLLRLSNYSEQHRVASGERWRFTVRLRCPRGTANPGGFDLPRHALASRIDAYGYLRERYPATRLAVLARESLRNERYHALQPLLAETSHLPIFNALLLGEKSAMPAALRTLLIETGTAHLMAISGLHIGIAAGLGVLLAKLVCIALPTLLARLPSPVLCAALALPCAAFYAALAGFAISTQRALLMLGCFAIATLSGRRTGVFAIVISAALAILIADPLAVLSGGFWLSFAAVVTLLLSAQAASRGAANRQATGTGRVATVLLRIRLALRSLMHAQAALLLGMPAVQLAIGLPVPAIAPLANAVAVPVVSLWVIPLGLAALLCSWPHEGIAEQLLQLADIGLRLTMAVLEWLQHSPIASWRMHAVPQGIAGIAGLCASLLLLSRARSALFGLAVLLWLSVYLVPGLAKPAQQRALAFGEYALLQLDVGQGTALLVQTRGSNLLFDTGASFGFGRDAAAGVIVPVLAKRGVRRLDTVIVSHADSDHSGGVRSLAKAMQVGRWFTGGRAAVAAGLEGIAMSCSPGIAWQDDGLLFQFLHGVDFARSGSAAGAENNASCVLAIRPLQASAGEPAGKTLLTGDIEKRVEWQMLDRAGQRGGDYGLAADVLMVPHHGSKTSSSESFLDAVAPKFALVSAGFGNRYGHPAKQVLHRYRERRIQVLRSDLHGAIELRFVSGQWQQPVCTREQQQHFWSYPIEQNCLESYDCANAVLDHCRSAGL